MLVCVCVHRLHYISCCCMAFLNLSILLPPSTWWYLSHLRTLSDSIIVIELTFSGLEKSGRQKTTTVQQVTNCCA